MSEVLGKVTRARSVTRWAILFAIFALWFLLTTISGADGENEWRPTGERDPLGLLTDFYYPPQPDLPYPSCKLTKGFELPDREFNYLFDQSFISTLTYETPEITKYYLDKWFASENALVEETGFVAFYREQTGTADEPVSFKLFSIPSAPGMGIVAIRGTQVPADVLLNYQLWLSSIIMEIVRRILPLGWIWNSIYPYLLYAVGWVDGHNLNEAAYYRVTTGFVNDLLENNYTYNGKSFSKIRVTGVSLGGGLAMITAAQTNATSVTFSGPNGVLPRLTFDPPLSVTALNTKTLNVIPDRDPIGNIGDRARLIQQIRCRAPLSSLTGCHSMWRTLCELLYSCGSAPRPVLCTCAENYGYPEPIMNGTRTFADACAEEKAIVEALAGKK